MVSACALLPILCAEFVRQARNSRRSRAGNDKTVSSALVAGGVEPELARLVADDAFGRSEHARSGSDAAALVAQCFVDHLALESIHRLPERELFGRCGRGLLQRLRQV